MRTVYLWGFLAFHLVTMLFFCKAFGTKSAELRDVGQVLTRGFTR